ncbi:hypothetical protein CEXT_67661 [Caerostris extrusa]|uniref:Uncharacterized protein n=1 Tax=Caerostris extrusa TaxID=172846 RepID=A0AAV4ML63_CAEEX|nr:hypothetical protein CEXT_67661 [Caerostris extrusa]
MKGERTLQLITKRFRGGRCPAQMRYPSTSQTTLQNERRHAKRLDGSPSANQSRGAFSNRFHKCQLVQKQLRNNGQSGNTASGITLIRAPSSVCSVSLTSGWAEVMLPGTSGSAMSDFCVGP